MKLGADSPETFDEMIDRAVEEIEAKPPLLLRIVGWPILLVGFAILSLGYVFWLLGRRMTGVSR